jgi:hypothetical protein
MTNIKRIHPFTGEEYIMDENTCRSTDDALIYLVEHEGERMYVLVYTSSRWPVQSNNNTEYIYRMDVVENDTLSTRSEDTSKFKDNSFTLDKVYTPYGYEAPEVLYFTDAVVDVIELVGSGYTGGYNNTAYEIPECGYLYTNGPLTEHRHIPQRMHNDGVVDASLTGMDAAADSLPEVSQLSSPSFFPHSFRLYYTADINDDELVVTQLTMITDTQESE